LRLNLQDMKCVYILGRHKTKTNRDEEINWATIFINDFGAMRTG